MSQTANKEVVASIDRTLREVEVSLRDIDKEIEEQIKLVTREGSQRKINLLKQQKQLEKARKVVVNGNGEARTKKPTRGKSSTVDPHRRAGPGAIKKVHDYLQRFGKAYQSAIVTDLPLQPSVVSYAVAALLQDGLIKPTGESYRGSKEYSYVGDRGRIQGVEPGVGEYEGRKREQVTS